jgi:NAD(P)-dependent dehydrogenase (short-subunit alcohol dehydrogenase family)
MPAWSFHDIPDQTGRTAIVTGANTGIGYETARALARKGARVSLACRDLDKGRAAVSRIQAEGISGAVELLPLDLSDLESVRAFATTFRARHERLDLLVNNAGVMIPPFSRTKQGFELQFGTNHLGHFALTGHLLPLLYSAPGSRVVVVYSGAYREGRIQFDDVNYHRRPYRAW